MLEARSTEQNSAICDELKMYLSVAVRFSSLICIVCWCKICCIAENSLFLMFFFEDSE